MAAGDAEGRGAGDGGLDGDGVKVWAGCCAKVMEVLGCAISLDEMMLGIGLWNDMHRADRFMRSIWRHARQADSYLVGSERTKDRRRGTSLGLWKDGTSTLRDCSKVVAFRKTKRPPSPGSLQGMICSVVGEWQRL